MLARTPIQTVMSGPVAGVIGSRHLGDVKGIENLITFDTGGTSSDMAVLPGRPLFKSRGDGRAPSAAHAHRRHRDHRRRRRQHRLGAARRRAQGRAAERRRRSRPGLLRPRRQRADADRRAGRARAISIPRRCSTARCRSRSAKAHDGGGDADRRAARDIGRRGGVGHPARARDQRDGGDAHHHGRARLRSARIHAGAVRRHGADHRRR